MKNIFITSAFVLFLTGSLMAQQTPLSSQLYFMRMTYNPALTAYNGSSNIYAYDREQWVAMPGHPSTRGMMGEISLWKDQSGVGFHVFDDVTSVINNVNAQLYYAQKIKLAKDHILSLGVSIGFMETHINFGNLIANDGGDPNILSNTKGGMAFDMNVGLAYQWKKLTIGFSLPHVANSNVTIAEQLKNTEYNTERHYAGGISYEFSTKEEKWNIEPSVLVKKGSSDPIQVDANVMVNYKRIVFFGLGYRLNYGITGSAAVRISKTVTLGYAYDYPMVTHTSFGSLGGTHEVLVGINLDRWLKKDELKQQHRIDTLENKMQTTQKRLEDDSTKLAKVDSLDEKEKALAQQVEDNKQFNSQAQKTQEGKVDELKARVDSFDQELKAYRKQVKKKPVTKFPDVVNKQNPVNEGDIYKMDKVQFEKNSSYLKPESYGQLDKLVELMKANPEIKVRVMGHTDYIASDEYNLWLSNKRAKRVADYIASKGVPEDHITSIGFGKRSPIADNSTEEGRATNRRVEIQILKK